VGAQENLYRSDTAPEFFQMPAADSEMLSFSIFDVLKRVEGLRTAMRTGGCGVPVERLTYPHITGT
jgi:hypothetical protein